MHECGNVMFVTSKKKKKKNSAYKFAPLHFSPLLNWAFDTGKEICLLGEGGKNSIILPLPAPVLPADAT